MQLIYPVHSPPFVSAVMSHSIHPEAVTGPPSLTERALSGLRRSRSNLPPIFTEMTQLVVAVVLPVALILLCISSPPYYDLKLIPRGSTAGLAFGGGKGEGAARNTTYAAGEMGLEYYFQWRPKLWGITFFTVSTKYSLHQCSLTTILVLIVSIATLFLYIYRCFTW